MAVALLLCGGAQAANNVAPASFPDFVLTFEGLTVQDSLNVCAIFSNNPDNQTRRHAVKVVQGPGTPAQFFLTNGSASIRVRILYGDDLVAQGQLSNNVETSERQGNTSASCAGTPTNQGVLRAQVTAADYALGPYPAGVYTGTFDFVGIQKQGGSTQVFRPFDVELTIGPDVGITQTAGNATVDMNFAINTLVDSSVEFCLYSNETNGALLVDVESQHGSTSPRMLNGLASTYLPYEIDLVNLSNATLFLDSSAASWTAGATTATAPGSAVDDVKACMGSTVGVTLRVLDSDLYNASQGAHTDTITLTVSPP